MLQSQFIADRAKAAAILFPNVAATPGFRLAQHFSSCIAAGVVIVCMIQMYRVHQVVRRTRILKKFPKLILLLLSGQSLIILITCVLNIVIIETHMSWWLCVHLAPFVALFYGLAKAFSNELTYHRAKSTLRQSSTNAHMLLKVTRIMVLGLVAGVPYVYFVWTGRQIYREQYCTVVLDVSEWLMVLYAIVDLNTSSALLLIFVIPLRNHANIAAESSSGLKFRKTMKRNIVLSSVAMVSSMFVLYSIALGFTTPSDVAWKQYRVYYSNLVISFDLCLSLCVNFMTFHKLFSYTSLTAVKPKDYLQPSRISCVQTTFQSLTEMSEVGLTATSPPQESDERRSLGMQ